jgi:hypothetical protein
MENLGNLRRPILRIPMRSSEHVATLLGQMGPELDKLADDTRGRLPWLPPEYRWSLDLQIRPSGEIVSTPEGDRFVMEVGWWPRMVRREPESVLVGVGA